jgi:hypothetical protein
MCVTHDYNSGEYNMRQIHNVIEQLNHEYAEGPYLQRDHNIHAKIVNLAKSIAVEVNYENLPNIENFLTNFNQLVLQCGLINKFLFCIDLPLSLLT